MHSRSLIAFQVCRYAKLSPESFQIAKPRSNHNQPSPRVVRLRQPQASPLPQLRESAGGRGGRRAGWVLARHLEEIPRSDGRKSPTRTQRKGEFRKPRSRSLASRCAAPAPTRAEAATPSRPFPTPPSPPLPSRGAEEGQGGRQEGRKRRLRDFCGTPTPPLSTPPPPPPHSLPPA